jgi:hypothetical protein
MKIMNRMMLIAMCLPLLAGCATSQQQVMHNPFREFPAIAIARVELCTEESRPSEVDPFWTEEEQEAFVPPPSGTPPYWLEPEGIAITNRSVISELHAELAETEWAPDADELPLLGILGHQVFLDANGQVLAVTRVYLWDCFVGFTLGHVDNGTIVFGGPNGEDLSHGHHLVDGRRFCRTVFNAMREENSAEYQRLDRLCRESGPKASLEELIFHTKEWREKLRGQQSTGE